MTIGHACSTLALVLALASNLALAHGGHAGQPPVASQEKPAYALPMYRC